MSWPPSQSTSFLLAGVTSIKWGTEGLISTFIVKSMRAMDSFETIYIENGTGLRATRVGLVQGREWEVTVVDDTSFTNPSYADTITITDPISGTLITGHATVIDNSYNTARKQEGDRVIRMVMDTLIDGLPPS